MLPLGAGLKRGNGHVRTIPGVSRRNSPRVQGDARSSHALVLAICLVFVRGMDSRPRHAGPVSKLFLPSRRLALDPFPQPEQSGPGGARSCVASHSWSWPLLMCPFAAHPINAGRPLIDPMRHVAWLALRSPATPSSDAPIASAMAVSGLPRAATRPSQKGRGIHETT